MHLKIPKGFLLDGCMYLSYLLLSLGYLLSGERTWHNLFSQSKIFTQKLKLQRPPDTFSNAHLSLPSCRPLLFGQVLATKLSQENGLQVGPTSRPAENGLPRRITAKAASFNQNRPNFRVKPLNLGFCKSSI